jgi:hypothetical protein
MHSYKVSLKIKLPLSGRKILSFSLKEIEEGNSVTGLKISSFILE